MDKVTRDNFLIRKNISENEKIAYMFVHEGLLILLCNLRVRINFLLVLEFLTNCDLYE